MKPIQVSSSWYLFFVCLTVILLKDDSSVSLSPVHLFCSANINNTYFNLWLGFQSPGEKKIDIQRDGIKSLFSEKLIFSDYQGPPDTVKNQSEFEKRD